MVSPYLHLGSPRSQDHPHLEAWVSDAWDKILPRFPDSDWRLREFKYDQYCDFVATDQITAALSLPGPILLINPVKKKTVATLKNRIIRHFPVQTIDASCPDQLVEAVDEIINQYLDGKPLLPRNYVIGVLIVSKLTNLNMWGAIIKAIYGRMTLPKGVVCQMSSKMLQVK